MNREDITTEALSWIGTPYHHHGRLKGVGADCAMFPAAVYGVEPDIGPYPAQWHLHHDEERYLEAVLRHAVPVEAPGEGDFVLWKYGRCFSHGGIVIRWPLVVHARLGLGVILDDASINQDLRHRKTRFFSPFGER